MGSRKLAFSRTLLTHRSSIVCIDGGDAVEEFSDAIAGLFEGQKCH